MPNTCGAGRRGGEGKNHLDYAGSHSKNHLDCWVTLKAIPCNRVSWGVDVPTE